MALVKYNDRSLRNLTTVPAAVTGNSPGALVHIRTLTASSSSALSFVDGSDSVVLDNTYPIYKFEFINIHSANNDVLFKVGFRDGSTDYDASKTTTLFQSEHDEDDGASSLTGLSAGNGDVLHNETGFQVMTRNMGNGNDECMSGELMLFNPSSTTFVKHFMFTTNINSNDDSSDVSHGAGYCNVTAAIDAVQFSFNSGDIDAGQIKLYGIKDA